LTVKSVRALRRNEAMKVNDVLKVGALVLVAVLIGAAIHGSGSAGSLLIALAKLWQK
jgi:hypothetical protein